MNRLAVCACFVWVVLSQAARPVGAEAAPIGSAPLPSTRLEFGLSNLDVGWMTDSGVPWRYRFTYLAGGVNTQGNWLTWQDPAKPPGQFALDYMTSSVLPPAAYIPIFTWYQLLQSTPSTGGNELERDYNNLNNASTMSTYYASFKILMQKAGQYGGQVVVHVEPDLWGYMQQKAAGAGATAVSAKVRSSGFAEAAAFSDNLAGFSSALEYLRDTYAPNALLATHASMWSSSIDIASDTRTSIDARAEADKTAAFLNSAGAGSWDAVFNDVDDHNAAWWELASCGTPPCVNQWFTHWWDPNNINFPNFSRYLAWVDQLHQRTVKPQVVWQVPMGNQYFLTMNNTCGHYQDNVAPYFIAHAGDLFSAGLVAVLFGPGNSCQTSNEDGLHDGVTNNGGGPITDRLGGCVACNSQPSNFADDDGGYLRIFVSRYYAGQSPCGSATATAAPSPPQAAGTAVDLTATSAGCANPQYEFWMLSPGASSWRLMRAYSTSPTWTWNTAGLAAGTYRFSVWARDSSSSGLYTNSLGSYDAFYTGLAYSLVPSCTSVALSTSPAPPVMVGTQIALNASAAGCLHPSAAYEFWILYPGSGTWRLAQPYSSSPSYSWTTAGLAPGTYRFSVWVRDSSSSAAYDAWNANQYFTLTPGCSAVATSARGSGSPLTIAGAASGCLNPSPLYEFWILYPGSGAWRLAQGYSTSATYSWATTGLPRGTYRFSVWVMDSSSSAAYDAWNATLYYALS